MQLIVRFVDQQQDLEYFVENESLDDLKPRIVYGVDLAAGFTS